MAGNEGETSRLKINVVADGGVANSGTALFSKNLSTLGKQANLKILILVFH